MTADDALRLAWISHRHGREAHRDALLTLAVASGVPSGAPWVDRVRDFLVSRRRDHLFATFVELDEALSDRRVMAALGRLRLSFPPERVEWLVRRDAVGRGPYSGRSARVETLLGDILAKPRVKRLRDRVRLGLAGSASSTSIPAGALAPLGAVTTHEAGLPEASGPILAFYLTVLLGIAGLCALVLEESRDSKKAA